MKIKCILADDELLGRRGLENYVKEIPFIDLVATCTNAKEVMAIMASVEVDLLLLDIMMPDMNGISLLRSVPQHPATIITTAYPEYAIESFELNVIDYLLKPISFERFTKAVHKAKDYIALINSRNTSNNNSAEYCFVKCNKIIEKIFYKELMYVEALQNYVVLHTTKRKYVSYLTLKNIEDHLHGAGFVKINKSQIINIQMVNSVEGNKITLDHLDFIIGRAFKDSVVAAIFTDRLVKR